MIMKYLELFYFRLRYPLKKDLENNNNYLKPIAQIRFSPTNGKDISDSSGKLQYDNIFSPNRIGRSDMVEKGKSLTLGIEFEKQDFKNEKILGINLEMFLKMRKITIYQENQNLIKLDLI